MLLIPNRPSFKLPAFEGPLDLLLHLIRENKVDIYDIPIAEITRQYLDYLTMWESLDLAVAGEYILMAATLLEIKSRMLLPQPPPPESEDDMDPRAELVQKLLEYQRYQGTIETLRGWEEDRGRLYFRGALENPEDYVLPLGEGEMNASALLSALRRMLEQAGLTDEPVTAVIPRRRVSLRMKMAESLRKIRAKPDGLNLEELFEIPWHRYDLVITFLAVLELMRLLRVRVKQKHALGEILLFPVEVTN
jgi:segregation and condensation protein A